MDGTNHSVADHYQCCRPHHSSVPSPCSTRRLARRRATASCRWILPCMGRLRALWIVLLIHVRTLLCLHTIVLIYIILSLSVLACISSLSLEAFARICVSGFLLDPEVPVSTLFQSPFSSYPDITRPPNTAAEASFNLARTPSTHSQAGLHRGSTITQRLRNFRTNLSRPFALSQAVTTSLPSASELNGKDTPSRARSDTV